MAEELSPIGREDYEALAASGLAPEPLRLNRQPPEDNQDDDTSSTVSSASVSEIGSDVMRKSKRVGLKTDEDDVDWTRQRRYAEDNTATREIRLQLSEMARLVKHLELRLGCDMRQSVESQRFVEKLHVGAEEQRWRGKESLPFIAEGLGLVTERLTNVLHRAEEGVEPFSAEVMDLNVSERSLSAEDVAKGKSIVNFVSDTWQALTEEGQVPTQQTVAQQAWIATSQPLKERVIFPAQGSDEFFSNWFSYTRSKEFAEEQYDLLTEMQAKAASQKRKDSKPNDPKPSGVPRAKARNGLPLTKSSSTHSSHSRRQVPPSPAPTETKLPRATSTRSLYSGNLVRKPTISSPPSTHAGPRRTISTIRTAPDVKPSYGVIEGATSPANPRDRQTLKRANLRVETNFTRGCAPVLAVRGDPVQPKDKRQQSWSRSRSPSTRASKPSGTRPGLAATGAARKSKEPSPERKAKTTEEPKSGLATFLGGGLKRSNAVRKTERTPVLAKKPTNSKSAKERAGSRK